jgi:DNA invertase Pin-like site-specific DNA recombinase
MTGSSAGAHLKQLFVIKTSGRSLIDLVNGLQELHSAHVDLFLHQQAIDTTTPAGRAMFGMLGVFAEFERSIIVSRINAGIARVRETGKTKSGKPLGRPMISAEAEAAIRARLQAGVGMLKVAGELGIGSSVVQELLQHRSLLSRRGTLTEIAGSTTLLQPEAQYRERTAWPRHDHSG